MDFFKQFYTFDGELGRLEFIICLVAMWLFLSIVNQLLVGTIGADIMVRQLISVLFPVVAMVLHTPVFIKRLRHMGWPKKLMILFYTAAIFNLNLLQLLGGETGFLFPALFAMIPAFIIFVAMLLLPGKLSETE